jgi:hypothetical protein
MTDHDLSPSAPFAAAEGQPSNNERASYANTALSAFVNEVAWGEQDDEEMIGDLLCNIRHLADAQGWDIEAIWAGSREVYREEIAEQPKADASFAE